MKKLDTSHWRRLQTSFDITEASRELRVYFTKVFRTQMHPKVPSAIFKLFDFLQNRVSTPRFRANWILQEPVCHQRLFTSVAVQVFEVGQRASLINVVQPLWTSIDVAIEAVWANWFSWTGIANQTINFQLTFFGTCWEPIKPTKYLFALMRRLAMIHWPHSRLRIASKILPTTVPAAVALVDLEVYTDRSHYLKYNKHDYQVQPSFPTTIIPL